MRSRDAGSRAIPDRYMLITYANGLAGAKVWGQPYNAFLAALGRLTAEDASEHSMSVSSALDLLNINRLHSGVDTYGQGRNPWFINPTAIVHITDGGPDVTQTGLQDKAKLLSSRLTGSELTAGPYRWDQRIFSIVLQARDRGPARRDAKRSDTNAVPCSTASTSETPSLPPGFSATHPPRVAPFAALPLCRVAPLPRTPFAALPLCRAAPLPRCPLAAHRWAAVTARRALGHPVAPRRRAPAARALSPRFAR